ncbi:SixA phosphatase family protein [Tomitella biformata]|uniref:SixA phosphatase family protein n=1 Tax=Tomitella biformata TaxID=630403 RepID=UPI0004653283|nr:histidine phosphatase family protein [Tomitella biformata]
MTRTLILMRHGKAESPFGIADHDRPLAPRGRHEAALAGELLERYDVDAALCSTAERTRQTLAATELDVPTEFSPRLYLADPESILLDIAETDDSVQTLLVVAHFPGIPETILQLDPSGPHTDEILDRFPTSAYAVIEVPGEWSDLQPGATTGAAAVTEFTIPR